MTLTPDQRDLLRRVAERIGADQDSADIEDLLSLCANLCGAKDRAEWKLQHGWPFSKFHCLGCDDPHHAWDDARWVAEWKKREGL